MTDPTSHQTRPLAVVTGASSGIGLELAREFASHGFDLLVVADGPDITQVPEQISSDGEIRTHRADLSTFEGVESVWSAVQEYARPVDAIALNAGFGVYGDFTRETRLEDELKLINLNIVACVHLAKRVGRQMVERGEGRILFTSSIASAMPGPLYAVYAASKAFVQSFGEALRNELEDTGVSVTTLLPGITDTHFFERAGMEDTKAGQGSKDDPAQVAAQGFAALMAGDHKVVGGSLKNKVQAVLSRAMPDPVKAAMHRSSVEQDPSKSQH